MDIQKAIRHAPLVKAAVIVLLIMDLLIISTYCFYNLSGKAIDIQPGILTLLQWLNTTIIVPYMVKSGYEHGVNKREETKIRLSEMKSELEGNGK